MDISQFSQSKYLKQTDLADVDDITVTITEVNSVNVAKQGEAPSMRAVVSFKEDYKPMVFNKTNLVRAAKIFGSTDTDDWIGKKLRIYVDEDVSMGGEIVGGLRVKPVPKKAPQAPAKPASKSGGVPDMDDDFPF